MSPTPREVASRIPKCPACGHTRYEATMLPSGTKLRLDAIRCRQCKADILAAYRKTLDSGSLALGSFRVPRKEFDLLFYLSVAGLVALAGYWFVFRQT